MGICVLYGAFCRQVSVVLACTVVVVLSPAQVQPELQFEVCSARELAITE
jgi:hypothetical protein